MSRDYEVEIQISVTPAPDDEVEDGIRSLYIGGRTNTNLSFEVKAEDDHAALIAAGDAVRQRARAQLLQGLEP